MKRIIGSLALIALLIAPALTQAQTKGKRPAPPPPAKRVEPSTTQAKGLELYVAPRLGLYAHLESHDMAYGYSDGYKFTDHFDGDDTYSGAIAIGYDFKRLGSPVRAELELAFFGNAKTKRKDKGAFPDGSWWTETERTTIGIKTLFVNGYHDFHNRFAFTPYVGLGLGVSFVDMKSKVKWEDYDSQYGYDSGSFSAKKKSSTNTAWNMGTGFSYVFTNRLVLDVGYRFLWIGNGKSATYTYANGDSVKRKAKDLQMHQVMVGMRFPF